MLKFAAVCIVIAGTIPICAQVEPAASGGGFDLDDTHMMTPPPVSNNAYPVTVGSESRSNSFAMGITFTGAYVDNLLGAGNSNSASDETYSFSPSIGIDRSTPRHSESLHYMSAFNLYRNTSELNGASHDVSAQYRFHLSPYTVIQLDEAFQKNNNLYNRSNPFVGSGVSGNPEAPNTVTIAPFADQFSSSSSAGINYQYGRNAMIGGSGSYSFLNYSGDSPQQALEDGNSTGAIGFYSRRIAPSEYIGVAYQFSKFVSHPIPTYTQAQTIFAFYTHYFSRSFSLSLLGGPERYVSWNPTVPKRAAWTPAAQGSVGWQTLRTNLGVSFTHIVSGEPGLTGTFHGNLAAMNGRLLFSPKWSAGADAGYWSFNSVNPGLVANPGGHSLGLGIDLQRSVGGWLLARVGYSHFHESYQQIGSSSPDSNRVYVSISCGLRRPLGR